MQVLNITTDDFANLSYQIGECLRAAAVPCTTLKLLPHPFGYPHQSELATVETIAAACRRSDVVQIFHSDLQCLDLFRQSQSNARLVVWHTGTPYRANPQLMNANFEGATVICDEASLMHLAPQPHFVHTGVDTDAVQPVYYSDGAYVFAHYPSNVRRKGTAAIVQAMTELPVNFVYSNAILSGQPHWDRMRRCDVYIELLNNFWYGEYGNYGVTATDAAALGKIVITQCLYPEVYEEVYGDCALHFVADERDLIDTVGWVNSLTSEAFLHEQRKTRQWVVDKHNLAATGERVKSIICS